MYFALKDGKKGIIESIRLNLSQTIVPDFAKNLKKNQFKLTKMTFWEKGELNKAT